MQRQHPCSTWHQPPPHPAHLHRKSQQLSSVHTSQVKQAADADPLSALITCVPPNASAENERADNDQLHRG